MSLAAPARDADAIEELFARGVTDGLPVVPPTRARVDRVLAASGRAPDALIAMVPPNYGRATVEKIAVNAVMAGCRPEYLPVVIAAVEAVCDEAFDLHGASASTDSPRATRRSPSALPTRPWGSTTPSRGRRRISWRRSRRAWPSSPTTR